MPWKASGVQEERFRFVEEWARGEFSMAGLCRRHGVTRMTGYKWVARYEAEGLGGLADRSRAPRRPWNALPEEAEEAVVELRRQRRFWGARKIRAYLERQQEKVIPAVSTIGAILKSHGLTVPRKRRMSARPSSEPLGHATEANRVWCADFKGWFRTGDGERIDPLTISDAYSRYLLRCQAVKAADTAHSQPVFEAAFREYGLPEKIRTDNGAPFGSNGESGLTQLSVWWIKLGIRPERIAPGKPQQNGRHERMHRTLKQETASPPAGNRRRQQERFDAFRREYNEERPHEALEQQTPASQYGPSPRPYRERMEEISYPGEWELRRVSEGGEMRWKVDKVFVAHALEGERVGLEPLEGGHWRVWFSFYELGVLERGGTRIWRPEQWEKREQRRRTQSGESGEGEGSWG